MIDKRQETRDNRASGFTIVELMIATAVFSVVLLLCATAIVQVGQMFYKGVTINRTQDTARKVADNVIQAIQFGVSSNNFSSSGNAPNSGSTICLGEIRYTYITTVALGTAPYKHVLWRDRPGSYACSLTVTGQPDLTLATPSNGGEELLGSDMRIPFFNITSIGNVWTVSITVAYGSTDDLFVTGSNHTQCVGRNQGGQFCAVSAITSNVVKRL